MPTRPYTTEGMPARRLTASSMAILIFLGATFAVNTAVMNPMGTPMTIAPAVPYILVSMKGSMPNCGSAAVDAHFVPNRKSMIPISLMAGMPAITRYTVISSTQAMVTSPRIRKINFTTDSILCLFILFLLIRHKDRQTILPADP